MILGCFRRSRSFPSETENNRNSRLSSIASLLRPPTFPTGFFLFRKTKTRRIRIIRETWDSPGCHFVPVCSFVAVRAKGNIHYPRFSQAAPTRRKCRQGPPFPSSTSASIGSDPQLPLCHPIRKSSGNALTRNRKFAILVSARTSRGFPSVFSVAGRVTWGFPYCVSYYTRIFPIVNR